MGLSREERANLEKIALTLRGLSMDGVQKANSGHPGLPLGCAEIAAYLWGMELRQNPADSKWLGRDRFILSAGHGSMLLYSALHLAGYQLSLDQLKKFRQLHSETPGHPEKLDTDGVETTTGPLGQGVGNAVGQALGFKLLAERFNTAEEKLFSNKVFALAGDGCIMEGVSSEVCSFAGHLQLDNLVLIYDSNKICLDGPISETLSEDTKGRYLAYGWDVVEVDGHDLDAIDKVFKKLRKEQKKPTLVIAHTIIGKGAPTKSGTHKVHGSPLGEEEIKAAKKELGLPDASFYIPHDVIDYFKAHRVKQAEQEKEWDAIFEKWAKKHPEKHDEFKKMAEQWLPADLEQKLDGIVLKSPMAGRQVSQHVLEVLGNLLPQLYGGSADLSCSDLTWMKGHAAVAPGVFTGRNIKFGVREFGMGTMAIGLEQTQMILPYVGTFLTFSDYMRNAIRLASLQRSHVIYQFTHDSIFLGEDGPTHQPVEHYAALRAIPHLHFIRPADHHEVKKAWLAALYYKGPTVIALSRQNLPELKETNVPYQEGMGRGAYILRKEKKKPDYTILATGSEVSLALQVADELEKRGKAIRVISMPCWEIFEAQDKAYQEKILGGDLGVRVSIEAGISQGWHRYIGREGIAISIDRFGLSAPASDLAKEFGFTVEKIVEKLCTLS